MPPRILGTAVRAAGAFKATNSEGMDVMVLVFQQFTLADNERNGNRGTPGEKLMKLSTGHDVTKISEGQYVTSNGVKLSSSDPNRL